MIDLAKLYYIHVVNKKWRIRINFSIEVVHKRKIGEKEKDLKIEKISKI